MGVGRARPSQWREQSGFLPPLQDTAALRPVTPPDWRMRSAAQAGRPTFTSSAASLGLPRTPYTWVPSQTVSPALPSHVGVTQLCHTRVTSAALSRPAVEVFAQAPVSPRERAWGHGRREGGPCRSLLQADSSRGPCLRFFGSPGAPGPGAEGPPSRECLCGCPPPAPVGEELASGGG